MMSTLSIFKTSLVNALRGSLDANLERYLREDVWIGDVSTRSTREMPTNVEVSEPLFLDPPNDADHRDIDNAIRLHRALHHLTPLQARDRRRRQRRPLAQKTPQRQVEVTLRQPVQVELRQQLSDLSRPPLEQRQDPALKALLQPPHSRPAHRHRPRTQGQLPGFAITIAVSRHRIHCPASLPAPAP